MMYHASGFPLSSTALLVKLLDEERGRPLRGLGAEQRGRVRAQDFIEGRSVDQSAREVRLYRELPCLAHHVCVAQPELTLQIPDDSPTAPGSPCGRREIFGA